MTILRNFPQKIFFENLHELKNVEICKSVKTVQKKLFVFLHKINIIFPKKRNREKTAFLMIKLK